MLANPHKSSQAVKKIGAAWVKNDVKSKGGSKEMAAIMLMLIKLMFRLSNAHHY